MTRPWLLVVAGGVTVGALFGAPGVALWAVGVALAAMPGGKGWVLLAAAGVVAAGAGTVRVAVDARSSVPPAVIGSEQAQVEVSSVPQIGPSGPRAVVRVETVRTDGSTWEPASGAVLVLFRDHAPAGLGKGDRLRITWSVKDLDASTFGRFVRASGASASADAFNVTVVSRGESVTSVATGARDLVTERIGRAIPGDAGALIAGFVTGDDSGLTARTRKAFERTGMSHITAVSGSNVAVLLGVAYGLVPDGRHRRSLTVMLGIIMVIWLYVLLVGFGPGAVRAGLFATLLLPAARLGRRPDPLTALMTASAVMLLVQPDYAHSLGFWLSLAASTAIVVSVDRAAKGRGRLVLAGVVALVAAQVATLPIVVWSFGGWSPASLLANLVVGPIVSTVFPFAFLFALVVTALPWAGALLGWLPGLAGDVIVAIVVSIGDEASMLRVGVATPRSIALIAVASAAVLWVLSGETRRWLDRLGWRFPGIERHAALVVFGAGVGAWLAVIARSVLG